MILRNGLTYGRGFKFTAKKQNVVFSSSLVSYQTFQGWDWLGSISYSNLCQTDV